SPTPSASPTPVFGPVGAGSTHSLFVKSDGSLWTFGANGAGQLGDGTTTNSLSPVQVVSSGVASVATGCLNSHSLFIKSDLSYWGMGGNGGGALGDGTTVDRLSPTQIDANVTGAATGGGFSVFVRDGNLYATGQNNNGQL